MLHKYLIILPILFLTSCTTFQENLQSAIQKNIINDPKPNIVTVSQPMHFTPTFQVTSEINFFEGDQQRYKDKGTTIDIDNTVNTLLSLFNNQSLIDSSLSIPTEKESYVFLITFKSKW